MITVSNLARTFIDPHGMRLEEVIFTWINAPQLLSIAGNTIENNTKNTYAQTAKKILLIAGGILPQWFMNRDTVFFELGRVILGMPNRPGWNQTHNLYFFGFFLSIPIITHCVRAIVPQSKKFVDNVEKIFLIAIKITTIASAIIIGIAGAQFMVAGITYKPSLTALAFGFEVLLTSCIAALVNIHSIFAKQNQNTEGKPALQAKALAV